MAKIRHIKSDTGQPIEDFRQGDDVHKAVGDLYEYGRRYPHGRPHDYRAPERTPAPQALQPGFDEYRATFRQAKNSQVSPAPDESACQFPAEKVADHVDASGWVRGQGGESPHPFFDRGGPSGFSFDRKGK
jgi:hypothetical protein